jgi:hypothetical protein
MARTTTDPKPTTLNFRIQTELKAAIIEYAAKNGIKRGEAARILIVAGLKALA